VFNANKANRAGVLRFQPFHCDFFGFLQRFIPKGVRFASFAGSNSAVRVNICVYILTRTSKKVHARTTRDLGYELNWYSKCLQQEDSLVGNVRKKFCYT